MRQPLLGYLRKKVGKDIAEDILQDVFVKALAALEANRAPKNLVGWLYAAARTTVIDYYRAAKPTSELSDDLPEEKEADDQYLHRQLAECLRPLILTLPPIYRETLLATDVNGRKFRQVAAEQGVSLSAIKSRASRGRILLKETLQACCHVEITDGLVTDYHPKSSGSCTRGCR